MLEETNLDYKKVVFKINNWFYKKFKKQYLVFQTSSCIKTIKVLIYA